MVKRLFMIILLGGMLLACNLLPTSPTPTPVTANNTSPETDIQTKVVQTVDAMKSQSGATPSPAAPLPAELTQPPAPQVPIASLAPTSPNVTSTFTVSAVSLTASPLSYKGSCTNQVDFIFKGSVTSTGAGTVTYHFLRSDGAGDTPKTLVFSAAGAQPVSDDWLLGAPNFTLTGWEQVFIDSPNNQAMGPRAGFVLTCGP